MSLHFQADGSEFLPWGNFGCNCIVVVVAPVISLPCDLSMWLYSYWPFWKPEILGLGRQMKTRSEGGGFDTIFAM